MRYDNSGSRRNLNVAIYNKSVVDMTEETEEAEELAGLLREKGYPDDLDFVSRVLRTSEVHGCTPLTAADLVQRGVQLSGGGTAGEKRWMRVYRKRVDDGAAGGAGGAAGGAGGAAGGAGGAAGGAGGADDSSESADGPVWPAWTYEESADDSAGSLSPAWTYQESAESTDESAAAGSMQSAQRDKSAAHASVLIMLGVRSLVFRGSCSLPGTAPPPNTPQTPQETVQSADASADDSSHADEDSSESADDSSGEEAAGADDSSGEGPRQSRWPFTDITNRMRPLA